MSGGGFTERDQEALFNAVTASSLAKGSRVGLGFGGEEEEAAPRRKEEEEGRDDERKERKRRRSSRGKSRSRSREKGRRKKDSRRRSRSRSASRDRHRRYGRSRSRSRSRDRRRDKRRDRSRSHSKGSKSREKLKEGSGDGQNLSQQAQSAILSIGERIRQRVASSSASAPQPTTTTAAASEEPLSALERLKAKARASLQAAEQGDADLARTTKGGQAWERGDMARASEFLKEEEARATGDEAQLAAQARRAALIAAIEDEGVEALSESVPCKQERAAADRARQEAEKRRREEARAARRARRWEQASLPLFKRLRAGDRVEAKWSKDGVWYPGVVKATMHGGYPNMRAEVEFTGYGNVDDVSWRDIHLLSPAASESDDDGSDDGGSVRSSPSIHRGRPFHSRSPSPGVARRASSPSPSRGKAEEQVEEEEDGGLLNPALAQRLGVGVAAAAAAEAPPAAAAAAAVVVEEAVPAAPASKPLSWKEKALAAQRALKEKRGQQSQHGEMGSVLARASELARAVEETRVAEFLQDETRPKLAIALTKKPGRK